MSSVLKDVSPEYFDDPAAHPITLTFETSDDETLNEVGLCTALTMLFHAISIHGRDSTTKRSGKPRDPLQISYNAPPGTTDLSSICRDYSSRVVDDASGPATYYLYASDFWQRRSYRHPVRPLRPAEGTMIYQRFIPSFMESFSLRVASAEADLDTYASWQDSDRVHAFWGERGTRDHHARYLRRQLADPHVLPVLASFGDTAFAYFELYHAKEDAISLFAGAGDYDRGFHALVGHEAYRGPDRVRVWISSVTHYLFLADDRTQRVMLEPRVDNETFIGYLLKAGYVIEKEFNFPHKRSALVSITREKFFECRGVET
ncbi:protein of unknown function [Taphrina deformans PYCC 5710]|uniref:Acyltransferase MbtK/IucB-like conserved domain-containing protein n=1 Tax=Taphrina deformans (strain PYCC 5710 / ATCC 11124 / CBS 356.35 / IMI 108563 / JCM 9778 / NBRC 8474) TaxID=1097556 RepID=R4XGX7_TAPDE|nr:protein of unknown function [Taphrina deformans PYCC 5710]|eukprot:CCG83763.1 protein of unknown function [Taphrina deformans PYCC 5710]